MFRALSAVVIASFLIACSDDEPLLARAQFEVDIDGTRDGTRDAVDTFDDLQAVVPFPIILPSAPPDGLHVDTVSVDVPPVRDGDDTRDGAIVWLAFAPSEGTDQVVVAQLIGPISFPTPPTVVVDIDGIEGNLWTPAASSTKNSLSWRACGRTFWIDYPADILSDDAATDLAASLIAACVDRTDNPEEPDLPFDRDAFLSEARLQVYESDGTATDVEAFDQIQDLVPFTITLPPAVPVGTRLRSLSVQLPPENLSEEAQREETSAVLVISNLTVEQFLDEPQPGDPATPVDIRGVDGQLVTNEDGNLLTWRACDRTFTMAYPHDYLADKAVTDFAASLIEACE